MKKIITVSGFAVLALLLAGCASAPVQAPDVQEQPAPAEEAAPPAQTEIPAAEQKSELPAPMSENDKEYERSTTNVSVTKEVFNEDKAKILNIIKNLTIYMQNFDYKGWVSCLDEESISYWSKRQHLQKASNRLPKKGLRLNTLEDYFKFVFIPARTGHSVEEIRYESPTRVKAVQVKNETDLIYYNFHKVNGVWKLHLPKNPD